jgi:hypothetical protein
MLNDINVHLVRHDATSVDEQRGFLTWRVEMAPRAAEQRAFAYEVKAPKGMPLVLE